MFGTINRLFSLALHVADTEQRTAVEIRFCVLCRNLYLIDVCVYVLTRSRSLSKS